VLSIRVRVSVRFFDHAIILNVNRNKKVTSYLAILAKCNLSNAKLHDSVMCVCTSVPAGYVCTVCLYGCLCNRCNVMRQTTSTRTCSHVWDTTRQCPHSVRVFLFRCNSYNGFLWGQLMPHHSQSTATRPLWPVTYVGARGSAWFWRWNWRTLLFTKNITFKDKQLRVK